MHIIVLLGAGLVQSIAQGYTTMDAVNRNGPIREDYWKNKPALLGKIKLEDFTLEFAAA